MLLTCFTSQWALAADKNAHLSKEHKLKAAYLLNFTKYIDWPEEENSAGEEKIYICLQQATPFSGFLEDLAMDRKTGQDRQAVNVVSLPTAHTCNLTYLHSTLDHPLPKVSSSVTVLDSSRVAQDGASIIFYIENRKLRFEIDVASTRKLHVDISSELLKLAKIR
jgi:hypothetical protein